MAEKILSDDQTEAVVKEVYLVLPDSFLKQEKDTIEMI